MLKPQPGNATSTSCKVSCVRVYSNVKAIQCALERPLHAAVNHAASMMPTDAQTSARKCNIDVMLGV
eukprot:5917524-Amphidinium_carterae.1